MVSSTSLDLRKLKDEMSKKTASDDKENAVVANSARDDEDVDERGGKSVRDNDDDVASTRSIRKHLTISERTTSETAILKHLWNTRTKSRLETEDFLQNARMKMLEKSLMEEEESETDNMIENLGSDSVIKENPTLSTASSSGPLSTEDFLSIARTRNQRKLKVEEERRTKTENMTKGVIAATYEKKFDFVKTLDKHTPSLNITGKKEKDLIKMFANDNTENNRHRLSSLGELRSRTREPLFFRSDIKEKDDENDNDDDTYRVTYHKDTTVIDENALMAYVEKKYQRELENSVNKINGREAMLRLPPSNISELRSRIQYD
eukprot:CAMPEP_0194194324 /NCGR_PEP_ID=MMETSP0154-20130528/75527_1 /TAXON_ID=1049557 /ORGANISM="Thalassiothrix antarctica, Strain L6-D1" /LENGTH=319 /DNA_ID=CAMNT_0038918749 /DNA_START=350 /DNA_END=1309 /DNA_ORIENTATION=+